MIDPALKRRVKDLEIRAIHLVSNRFMGEWASNMRGQGLEFRDLREYVIGDDVRRLDWKATARSGKPQLRQFTEERQQNVWFALDLSASMHGPKATLAREIVAVLGWAAVRQGDPFGLVGFTDRIEIHRPAARGEAQLWAGVDDVVGCHTQSRQTDFSPVGEFFLKKAGNRATVIIVSDFAAGLDKHLLSALAMRHEVIALQITDPREEGFLPGALALFEDSESGERGWVDLSSPRASKLLRDECAASREETRAALRKAGIWYRDFPAGQDFLPPLMEFFHRRREVIGA
jgi:uncharacterized protein (DUF58 family)